MNISPVITLCLVLLLITKYIIWANIIRLITIISLGNINDEINKATTVAPKTRTHPGNPSLNRTRKKKQKIIEVPQSGCKNTRTAGSPIKVKRITIDLKVLSFTLNPLRYFAIASEVAILANSEG